MLETFCKVISLKKKKEYPPIQPSATTVVKGMLQSGEKANHSHEDAGVSNPGAVHQERKRHVKTWRARELQGTRP